MGSLTYDRVTVEFDDRILEHLEIVIVEKLRCGESFLFSWQNAAESGNGWSSVWLHPSIPLYFRFAGGHAAAINPLWLAQLDSSANSERGLVATGEDKASVATSRASRPDTTYGVHPASSSKTVARVD